MRGIVVKFDNQRGFGFIRADNEEDNSKDIFVHINDIDGGIALQPGQTVDFRLDHGEKGPLAVEVQPGRKQRSPFALFLAIATVVTIGLILLIKYYVTITWVKAYLIAINLTTMLFYGYDKKAAGHKRALRVPEMVLHLLALLGGTPLAFASQHLFRHKTVKGSFRIVFWLVVVIQIAIIWQFVLK